MLALRVPCISNIFHKLCFILNMCSSCCGVFQGEGRIRLSTMKRPKKHSHSSVERSKEEKAGSRDASKERRERQGHRRSGGDPNKQVQRRPESSPRETEPSKKQRSSAETPLKVRARFCAKFWSVKNCAFYLISCSPVSAEGLREEGRVRADARGGNPSWPPSKKSRKIESKLLIL